LLATLRTYISKREKKKNEKKKKKESHISGGAWRFVKVFGVLFDTYKKLEKNIKKNFKTRRA
jgi:hypothetical protein